MNARDIRLLTFYTDAIQALCEAQKESYSANVPKYLSAQIGDIARTMCTDLAGHVDPDVVPVTISPQDRAAFQKLRKCEDWNCTKCGEDCLLRQDLFRRKAT